MTIKTDASPPVTTLRPTSDYARRPAKLSDSDHTIVKGDTVWAIAAKELGLSGKELTPAEARQVLTRMNEYEGLNKQIPNINHVVEGDQLKAPPLPAARPPPRNPPGTPEEAATQTATAAQAAAKERETATKSLESQVNAVAENVAQLGDGRKPGGLTDEKKAEIAGLAKELFDRADNLDATAPLGKNGEKPAPTVGPKLRESPAGKVLQGIIHDAAVTDTSKKLDALDAKMRGMLTANDGPLTELEQRAVAIEAAPLLARAKELGIDEKRPSIEGLAGIVQGVELTDTRKAIDTLTKQGQELSASQATDSSESLSFDQKKAIASKAAPLLAKAKELGIPPSQTEWLQNITDQSNTTELDARLKSFLTIEEWSPANAALGAKLLEDIEKKAPKLLETNAGKVLKEFVGQNRANELSKQLDAFMTNPEFTPDTAADSRKLLADIEKTAPKLLDTPSGKQLKEFVATQKTNEASMKKDQATKDVAAAQNKYEKLAPRDFTPDAVKDLRQTLASAKASNIESAATKALAEKLAAAELIMASPPNP